MLDITQITQLSRGYNIPLEDVLFIALNTSGVRVQCDYNRMRTGLHLADSDLFAYAKERGELDYYLALPINQASPFVLNGDVLSLHDVVIGQTIEATEDICNDNYSRRGGTSLNLNPNSRTSCSGCEFCYTSYQIPNDLKRLKSESDLREFFERWMTERGLSNLSHLIQVSVVTGCYHSSTELSDFLKKLRRVLTEYKFVGRVFYLGSQIISSEYMEELAEVAPFGICLSLETFERRDLLRDKKKIITLARACDAMDYAMDLGYEVNFAYIVGTEPMDVMEYHFRAMKSHINKMPTINTLQMHKYHDPKLVDPSAHKLSYYLEARLLLERIFVDTPMRPLVWEDYRSLWFLTFNGEPLYGTRTP